jgi:SAM-dependent methyltransferase
VGNRGHRDRDFPGSEYARETLNVPVVTGDFQALEPPGPVDAVCAFHVLEHVEDPRAFLAAARRHLSPGGWLFLEVPNFGSVAATRRGHDWSALQPEFHRWHFDPDTLDRLVREAGFDVVTVDTAVFRLYMPGRYRRRHARELLSADLRNIRSLRLTHPRSGDLLRVVARRPLRAGSRPDDRSNSVRPVSLRSVRVSHPDRGDLLRVGAGRLVEGVTG